MQKCRLGCLVFIFAMVCLQTQAVAQDHVVGIGVQYHGDDGELDGFERVAVQAPREEDRTFRSDSALSVSLWYLKPLGKKLRVGGGFRYYGTYSLIDEVPDDTPEDELPEPQEFGSWMDFYGQFEWATPILKKQPLELVVGAQMGMILYFPGGALDEEITRLQDQNVGVWSTPRLGFLFGPQIGVRYRIIDMLSVRFDLGMRYNRVVIFSTAEEVDGVAFEKDWALNVLRYDGSLGVEVNF